MRTVEKSKIRKATISDVDQLLQLENKCFDSDQFNKNQFKYLVNKANGFVFVYAAAEKIKGSIILLRRKNAKNLRIYSIAVDPDSQGQGIASKLLAQAEKTAKNHEIKNLTLEVKSTNETAINLYLKSGFKTASVKENYYNDGNAALIMKKEI